MSTSQIEPGNLGTQRDKLIMERHIDILEKYYEEIRENSQLDIDPKEFAAKCVREYKEKRREEKERQLDIKKEKLKKQQAFQAEEREALKRENLERERIRYEREKKTLKTQEELMELGESTYSDYLYAKGERKMKALQDFAKLFDRIRGD